MNYRHAFHAGNFADVFKHALLVLMLRYLLRKEQPWRYLDTHAGIGLYDLNSDEAQRTGEWRNGIGRLIEADLPAAAAALLKPYLDLVRETPGNEAGALRFYPGSPLLARALARPQDRLTLVEKHPQDAKALRRVFGRDERVACVELDGYLAINAYVPPKERRGLVLVDPPFEVMDEFGLMGNSLMKAYAKWPTGTYALWYPIKDRRRIEGFARALADTGIRKILRLELMVHDFADDNRLNGNGLIVVNPPFPLLEEARTILPVLANLLAQGKGGFAAHWLVPE